MSGRGRRRRYNEEGAEGQLEESTQRKVKFVEQVDYKMEIRDGDAETKPVQIKIINDDKAEEEKREAFKKKLRKYSNKMGQSAYVQLP